MNNTNTGGPAFPHHVVCDKGWSETQELQGMTLRDYFAAKAMQGWLSTYGSNHGIDEVYEEGVANFAYEMASAMLSARDTMKAREQ